VLHRKFLWLLKADDQPMQNWIAIVRHTAFCLTQIGVEVSEEDFILVLTQGLPIAYETFVVSLDATDPSLLTSKHVIFCLLNEEVCQLALDHDHESKTAQKDTIFYVNWKKTPIERITCTIDPPSDEYP
jgi:gag-polypeptide of LTR copia-type